MPAGFFYDCETTNNSNNNNGLEDQRALQLAFELSMLGLINEDDNSISNNNNNNNVNHNFETEARTKKSQNTTECVPVPSSEHVAEIVGRQGCKIKALRAKTNTYIKTPVRGEEPVFVVTGRKEDVNAAKKEILSAAEHFSQIRAQRKGNLNGTGLGGPGPNSTVPGQMTIQVRVPYRVVGLVVGPKGATIKRIQQETNTYIITPSRDKEPIFEVTGLPENVERARKEIEAHIAIRTGGIIDSTTGATSSTANSSSGDSEASSREFLNNSPLFNAFSSTTTNGFGPLSKLDSDPFSAFSATSRDTDIISPSTQDLFNYHLNGHSNTSSNNNTNLDSFSKFGELYSLLNNNSPFNGINGTSFAALYEKDEGIGESPTFESLT